MKKAPEKILCECGHMPIDHNMGGKYACLINYNADNCLEFKPVVHKDMQVTAYTSIQKDTSKPIQQNDWEKDYEEQFGEFPTSNLWYIPVRNFIRQLLAQTREETRKNLIEVLRGYMPPGAEINYEEDNYAAGMAHVLEQVISELKSSLEKESK
jgi:hypothetical protein